MSGLSDGFLTEAGWWTVTSGDLAPQGAAAQGYLDSLPLGTGTQFAAADKVAGSMGQRYLWVPGKRGVC